jgi:nucleoside-diphosphate-sugar epimerase
VDTFGSVPRTVRDSARALTEVAKRYVYVSSVAAYRDWQHLPIDEASPLWESRPDWDPGTRAWSASQYGILKAGCERAVVQEFGEDGTLVVRPGVVLGPREYVGRLTWWLYRIRRGGEILAPGSPHDPIQVIDVRDLADFLLDSVDVGRTGAFNAVGPVKRDTFGDLLQACSAAVGSAARLTWVDSGWLATHNVRNWTELPMWVPNVVTWEVDDRNAAQAGLRCRPLDDTVSATWNWLAARNTPVENLRARDHGIARGREKRLLRKWHDYSINNRRRPF